jgi:hypothetical protein
MLQEIAQKHNRDDETVEEAAEEDTSDTDQTDEEATEESTSRDDEAVRYEITIVKILLDTEVTWTDASKSM